MVAITFYLDIGTLLEKSYTGISNVNYQLVKWFRTNKPDNSVFFHLEHVIHETIVDELLKRRTGDGLRDLYNRGLISQERLTTSLARAGYTSRVGIFSNAKPIRSVFDFEAQVIHDLTYLITPEFHHQATIAYYASTVEEDVQTSDLLVCVSQHTLDDVALYLGAPRHKMMVAHLGPDEMENARSTEPVEPYVLVLGTVEPRKNIALILDALNKRPDFLDTWRFVFVGYDGWGTSFETMMAQAGLERSLGGRVLRLGYVSDKARNALLQNAKLLVYPSFYEGFGLPVLEAMQVGCPTIASLSSSIVEVGGDVVRYIDPCSVDDLVKALDEAKAGSAPWTSSPDRLKARAAGFSWGAFCSSIHDRIVTDVSRAWRAA